MEGGWIDRQIDRQMDVGRYRWVQWVAGARSAGTLVSGVWILLWG